MMMFVLSLIFTFSYFANSGTNTSGYCASSSAFTVDKTIPVDVDINFFMRSAPKTKELGFATNLNKKKPVNKILNSETGEIRDVPGFIDPVLSPDGSIIATPFEKSFDPVSGKFIEDLERPYFYLEDGVVKYCKIGEQRCDIVKMTEKELRNGKAPFKMLAMAILDRQGNELLIDSMVNSFYQSLGQFNLSSNQINYRMLYETPDGLVIRDYQKSNSNGKLVSLKRQKPLCDGLSLALPAISKNGMELSAFDPVTNETRVFEIGKSGEECKPKERFPGMLGKTDFSPNGKKIAFHIDHASATKNSIFQMPDNDQDLSAYIYDREKKTFRQLRDVEGQQSYFPVFLSDDELALISSNRKTEEGDQFSILIGHLKSSNDESQCKTCFNPTEKDGQTAAFIGALVNEKCRSQADYNYKSSFFAFSHLSSSTCHSVVETCDETCMQSLKQKILKYVSSNQQSKTNKYAVADPLWNPDQIAKLKSIDELCGKIETLSNASSETLQESSASK